MDDPYPVEPGPHLFTGMIQTWGPDWGSLTTDSGVTIVFLTRGLETIPPGTRISMLAKRLRQHFSITRIVQR